jgi:hypothetical protein
VVLEIRVVSVYKGSCLILRSLSFVYMFRLSEGGGL